MLHIFVLNVFHTATLKLYHNGFSGPLPGDSFEKLTKLGTTAVLARTACDVANEQVLNAPLYCTPYVFLSPCLLTTTTEELDLNGNEFTKTIPESLHLLVKLEDLTLSNNQLTGQIPESLGDLSNLHELNLDGNQLVGSVPTTLGQLEILGRLHLNGNSLEGQVPQEVCELREGLLALLVTDCDSGEIGCDCCTKCH